MVRHRWSFLLGGGVICLDICCSNSPGKEEPLMGRYWITTLQASFCSVRSVLKAAKNSNTNIVLSCASRVVKPSESPWAWYGNSKSGWKWVTRTVYICATCVCVCVSVWVLWVGGCWVQQTEALTRALKFIKKPPPQKKPPPLYLSPLLLSLYLCLCIASPTPHTRAHTYTHTQLVPQ